MRQKARPDKVFARWIVISAGYNPRYQMTSGTWKYAALVGWLLVLVSLAHSAEFDEPAANLARTIGGISGPGTISLTFKNTSSMPAQKVTELRRALEAQLRIAGIRVKNAETAATDVTLTISENFQSYLAVAQVAQGNELRVAIQALPRTQTAVTPATSRAVTIKTNLLISQAQPILDATQLKGLSPYLAVLEPEQVVIYRMQASGWNPEQAFPITHSRTWPRDLRGRLVPATDHLFDIYLPGTICSASATSPLKVDCRESDDPWPLGTQRAFYGAARNFFNGVMTPGIGPQSKVEPFYSAAGLPRSNYTLWTMAGVDGRVRQYDGFNTRVVASARDWGSDIVAIKAECGAFLLVTGNNDASMPDLLRVYEVADREPVEAGQPLELAGPVTALWNIDENFATAVVYNLRSNNYEAHDVTLTCNR